MADIEASIDARPAPDPNDPLFSLPLDEGAGALIAAAAGDVAGGADPRGYSAITQVSTVIAYHLLGRGAIDRDRLAAEVLVLEGIPDGVATYRGASDDFRAFLDSARHGAAAVSARPSSEPASRAASIGVWFRRDPDGLIEAALASTRLTHLDATTAVAVAAAAGAVAGSCFVQAGMDLVYGAAETAERALRRMEGEQYRYGDIDRAHRFPARLRELAGLVMKGPREIVANVSDDNGPVGADGALLGILLGASKLNESIRLIEAGAMAGGSEVGAITGAIVGARSGLVRWPWRVPNDTWFAEIGRRLVSGNRETRDLPIPHAVEERMLHGTGTRTSDEFL
jgi:hypothetical protein